jgi:hypothetical protein
MRNHIESLQQQMHVVEKGNIEREKDRLQRYLDETSSYFFSNRRVISSLSCCFFFSSISF